MNEIEVRRSTLVDVDVKQRLIDLIGVPWEQETEVPWRGEVWHEVFSRGAFDGIEDSAGRIRVNREHVVGDTVGKVVHFDPGHDDGLFSRVKIAATPRGDETLTLADEDMLSASVGFRINSHQDVHLNQRTKLRRINKAFLAHIAMVEAPAYEGARVLAVRETKELEVSPLVETPLLDEILSDELLQWATSRSSQT